MGYQMGTGGSLFIKSGESISSSYSSGQIYIGATQNKFLTTNSGHVDVSSGNSKGGSSGNRLFRVGDGDESGDGFLSVGNSNNMLGGEIILKGGIHSQQTGGHVEFISGRSKSGSGSILVKTRDTTEGGNSGDFQITTGNTYTRSGS